MKKILLMALLAVTMTANAEEESNIIVLNEGNMAVLEDNDTVNTNDGGVKIAKGKDEDDRWSIHINFGVDIPTGAPSGYDFAPFRSWEVGVTIVQYDYTPQKSKTTFSAGLGPIFRNYTLKGHDKMFAKANDQIVQVPAESEMKDLSSSIYTMGFALPLLVKQRFGKHFAISLGAQLNWYCYARVNNQYDVGDNEMDINTKDIGHRPITVDILGIIHISKGFGFYCKYSPMSVLKENRGPEFRSISAGIYF